jgi:hypothetical protein
MFNHFHTALTMHLSGGMLELGIGLSVFTDMLVEIESYDKSPQSGAHKS